jgi:hypothetical protein
MRPVMRPVRRPDAASDEILMLVAKLALEALKELKSPGCDLL